MSPQLFGALVAALGGLAVGSFLNVVIWRLPRKESLITPASHCPNCGHAVRAYDNIPVLSWVILRGRCRDCSQPISARYPAVELLTAILAVAVAVFRHSAEDIVLGELLVVTLIPVALIDLDHRIIPNVILVPAGVAAVVGCAVTRPSGLPQHLIAGAGAGAFLLFFALAYPRGMGMGDVKLAAVLGLFLGSPVAVAILAALIVGISVGLGVIALDESSDGRKTAVPFGPFLAVGAIVAIFCGVHVVHWYVHSVL